MDSLRLESEKKCVVADRVRRQGSETILYWSWLSEPTSSESNISFQQLVISVLGNVQLSDSCDRWEWISDPAGSFSVKAVKRILKAEQALDNRFILDWCKWIPAKCNIHAWRMEMDRIPTGEALRKRNVQIGDALCPMCNSVEESAEHIFIGCHVASIVWNGISTWCNIPNIFAFSLKDLLGFYKDLRVSEKNKDAVHGIVMIACWSLWHARNSLKFSNIPVKIDSIINKVKALGFLWFANRSKHKGIG
ncbi:uncharacterized protein LOC110924345 [Helianthus annuus]|uniref:uncharacterized protein LOC110924345 n=1 Tax=Helianthus annuus TaxID=4232 RepID=UPI000B8F19AA|nr:uncharacterized protein LOC110924345 [Helianthus annuus]